MLNKHFLAKLNTYLNEHKPSTAHQTSASSPAPTRNKCRWLYFSCTDTSNQPETIIYGKYIDFEGGKVH